MMERNKMSPLHTDVRAAVCENNSCAISDLKSLRVEDISDTVSNTGLCAVNTEEWSPAEHSATVWSYDNMYSHTSSTLYKVVT